MKNKEKTASLLTAIADNYFNEGKITSELLDKWDLYKKEQITKYVDYTLKIVTNPTDDKEMDKTNIEKINEHIAELKEEYAKHDKFINNILQKIAVLYDYLLKIEDAIEKDNMVVYAKELTMIYDRGHCLMDRLNNYIKDITVDEQINITADNDKDISSKHEKTAAEISGKQNLITGLALGAVFLAIFVFGTMAKNYKEKHGKEIATTAITTVDENLFTDINDEAAVMARALDVYEQISVMPGNTHSVNEIADIIRVLNGAAPKDINFDVNDIADFIYDIANLQSVDAVNKIAGVEEGNVKGYAINYADLFIDGTEEHDTISELDTLRNNMVTMLPNGEASAKLYFQKEIELFINMNITKLNNAGTFIAGLHVLNTNAIISAYDYDMTITMDGATYSLQVVCGLLNPADGKEARKSIINSAGRGLMQEIDYNLEDCTETTKKLTKN